MRLPVKFRSLTALIAAAIAAVTATAAVTPPQGELRRDTPADYAPQPNPGRTHNEFWSWQFRFNDEVQVQLNLSRVHFGKLKDPVCGADLATMNFRGRSYFVAREYPLENFEWTPAGGRLAVHANIWAEGLGTRAQRVYFSTRKGGHDYFLDLVLEDLAPGAVWGNGVFRLAGGEAATLFLHVPRAKVRGRIGIDRDTVTVNGFGWMDHSRQTQFGTRFMDAGYRYVVTAGRMEGGYFFQDGGEVFGYGVREENGALTLLRPASISVPERASWGGVSVPKRLNVTFEGRAPLSLLRVEDRQRTSVLQELSGLERFGAKAYLGGELLGYRGTAKVNDSLPAVYSYTMVKR